MLVFFYTRDHGRLPPIPYSRGGVRRPGSTPLQNYQHELMMAEFSTSPTAPHDTRAFSISADPCRKAPRGSVSVRSKVVKDNGSRSSSHHGTQAGPNRHLVAPVVPRPVHRGVVCTSTVLGEGLYGDGRRRGTPLVAACTRRVTVALLTAYRRGGIPLSREK